MFLYFSGLDALNIAMAANRMPEVMELSQNLWRPARGYPEVRRLISAEPQLVRLVADARVLLEDLSGAAIQLDDTALLPVAQALPDSVPAGVKSAVYNALVLTL